MMLTASPMIGLACHSPIRLFVGCDERRIDISGQMRGRFMAQVRMSFPQLLRRAASCDGKEFFLPYREHALLTLLLLNRGKILSRDEIISRLWPCADGGPASAANRITQMVNIIHARSGAEFIEVCPGRGLLIDAPSSGLRAVAA
ncbi:hypothetical protein CG471_26475 [Sphingobium sp. IP1]|nr:hypothetical protein CG471_26475 [Sphingobium sp. IP1]